MKTALEIHSDATMDEILDTPGTDAAIAVGQRPDSRFTKRLNNDLDGAFRADLKKAE